MRETMLELWRDLPWPEVMAAKPPALGQGVIDQGTFDSIEVGKLFAAVNHARTTVGQAVLYRSLARPLAELQAIQAKQAAVEELAGNPGLRAGLERLVARAADDEAAFYRLLFGKFLGSFEPAREHDEIEGYGYGCYRRAVRFMGGLVEGAAQLPPAGSAHLRGLLATIGAFALSRDHSLMRGPVYITENGLQSKEERRKAWWVPAIAFRPRLFKPVLVGLAVAAYGLGKLLAPGFFAALPGFVPLLAPLLLAYLPIVGNFDRNYAIEPLRQAFKRSAEVGAALDALGQLDELLAMLEAKDQFGHPMALPTLIAADHHRLHLVDAKNPVLAKGNPGYVGNDLSLADEKLVMITGPNSGGKTAFCKTVAQLQLLAQIGAHVPARSATLTVADRIFYQCPEVSHLDDGEGRFGTELKRTRDIFLASTANSLVVLDEMSEGTTFEEKMASSEAVLEGFYRKGNSTLLITHNHQLVELLAGRGMGVPLQVEFADDQPTFRLVAGISRVSHADRVAKKIGFSKEDIDHYLKASQ